MATPEEENVERERLNTALTKLSEIKPEALIRRDELGTELSFEAGLQYFKRNLKLFKDLQNCSLDGISHSSLAQLAKNSELAVAEFAAIQNFSLQAHPSDALPTRDALINKVRDRYDTYYDTITPHIAYSVRKGTDFEALEQDARNALKEINTTKENLLLEQKKTKAETEGLLESMRSAAAEAGVSQHSIHFKDEADKQSNAAWWWLAVTVLIGVVAIGYALYTFDFYSNNELNLSTAQTVQTAIAKIIVFSVLYFALAWSGRNYRAHRHNHIINKHRQNALSTFQAFIKAAGEDETTKNAVLIKATEAIFSPEVSGYLTKEAEPKGTPQIIEIMRGVIGKQP